MLVLNFFSFPDGCKDADLLTMREKKIRKYRFLSFEMGAAFVIDGLLTTVSNGFSSPEPISELKNIIGCVNEKPLIRPLVVVGFSANVLILSKKYAWEHLLKIPPKS